MRFRIEGFDLNFHIDAEFALRDIGCCDSKKILHDPKSDNFSVFLFFGLYQQENGSEIEQVKRTED